VRVTTPPNADLRSQGIAGRFGLALPSYPLQTGASKEAVLYGLQQTGDAGGSGSRSNVACVHAGGGSLGSIRLEVAYHDGETGHDSASKDTFDLAPFGFAQQNAPLSSRGIKNGWATIRRVSGDDQFVCYATILDNKNGDSSYVAMVKTDVKSKKSDALLPVVVDTAGFKSELTIANRTQVALGGEFVVITPTGETEFGEIDVAPSSQVIYPDIMSTLRELGFTSVPPGSVASLFFTFEEATSGGVKGEGGTTFVSASDVFVGARTYATKAGGLFGLAYPFSILGDAADDEAYVYGLQQSGTRGQDGGTRSNLAVVHALDGGNAPITLEITYFDANAQQLGVQSVTLKPGQWMQINAPLAAYAGVTQGYARIRRTAGTDEFFAYGVLNDQANDDGSFVSMVIP